MRTRRFEIAVGYVYDSIIQIARFATASAGGATHIEIPISDVRFSQVHFDERTVMRRSKLMKVNEIETLRQKNATLYDDDI